MRTMEQQQLKIKIGDREYPLVVSSADVSRMREAEKLINERLQEYRNTYPTADRTDVMAMTALFLAHALLASDASSTSTQALSPDLGTEIARMRQLIEQQ